MRQQIKKKIKESGSVTDFADRHKIRRASLHDYLNNKKDVTTRLFFKIIKPLNMEVIDKDLK
jgi:hypothetical protein